jgi:cullin-associated NEDD8-dissociated protein 1
MGVQVNVEGNIAIIHSVGSLDVKERVAIDTGTYFGVFWENDGLYPTASANCGGVCDVHGNTCICRNVIVDTSAVFSQVSTVDDIMSKLKIGAPDPSLFDIGSYHVCTAPKCSMQTYKLHFRSLVTSDAQISNAFNAETIFEVTTQAGSLFLSNTKSTVHIGSGYSFRNPPMFNSPVDPTQRDGLYETDAILQQYVNHPNTAPFIATKLIKLLVSSNPSTRYVKSASDAFSTGEYVSDGQSFGSGRYGVSAVPKLFLCSPLLTECPFLVTGYGIANCCNHVG